MSSEKAFKTGSTAPDPPAPGVLRLISMRFCPYAHRTILALTAKGIEYETVNVCTVNKPEWFFAINPLAKVPTLQHDGKVVYESLVCNEYLDRVFPGRKLSPEEPLEKARIGMLQAIWDAKISPNFYKIANKDQEGREDIIKVFKEGMSFLEKEVTSKSFFGGDEPGFLDYSFWPWFERMPVLEVASGFKLEEAEFPKLFAWQAAMRDRPEVKEHAKDTPIHLQYLMSRKQGNPDPDAGLQA
ncbi:GSTO1 [Branchiostoma lanceolatum]|uniref:Glutathione S-transferase omega n=1 Tax=Branchiostoma lanceolatum TaxID=7740 RepID=A0A8K0EUK2_BRALA|nr:GSTO1 [Branchiostoma lanceolatum]